MRQVIALRARGRHDRRIGNRGDVVAADRAGQAGGDRDDQDLAAHREYVHHDRDEDGERAPGRARRKGEEQRHHEDDRREHDGQAPGRPLEHPRDELRRAQGGLGDAADAPREHEDQDRRDHGLEALGQALGELAVGEHAARHVIHERERQRKEGAEHQARRRAGIGEGIDDARALKEAAGVHQADHAARDQRNDRDDQVRNRAARGNRRLVRALVRARVDGVQVAVQARIVLVRLHHAVIDVAQGDEHDHQQRQQRVVVVGNRLNEQRQAVGALHHAADRRRPGADGRDDAHRRGRRVDDVRQLRAGDLVGIGHRAHDGADRQAVEVVVHEDQHAQQEGHQLRMLALLDLLPRPCAVRAGAAGFVDQRDHGAQEHQEDQDADVARVADLAHDHVKRDLHHLHGLQQAARGQHAAGEHAREQREIYLLGDQRQTDGHHRRQQRPGRAECVRRRGSQKHQRRSGIDDQRDALTLAQFHVFCSPLRCVLAPPQQTPAIIAARARGCNRKPPIRN